MATRRRQKQACISYNLLNSVEIPIELQVKDDSTFLDEFSSQPSAGQVLSSLKVVTLILSVQTGVRFFKRVLMVLIILIHR